MNYFEVIANGIAQGRVARLVAQGSERLANNLGRRPSHTELLNLRRKAEVLVRLENTNTAQTELLGNSGIFLQLPEPKLENRFKLPEDNWYHIAPKGEHPHPKGLVQVLDDRSIDTMVKNFKTAAKEPNFGGLLVDFDHISQSGQTGAAGWITNLKGKADGLWANIRWSDTGKDKVEGGEYRFVSPVWKRSDCQDLKDDRVRPLVLDSLAVTNVPNMTGLQPLSR